MMIYKVLRPAEWDDLQRDGETAGAPIDVADGFVHLSTADQLAETLAKHFEGVTDLVCLACPAEPMTDALKWEPSRGGALFPHLYRPLRMSDVAWHRPIGWDGARHVLPDGVA